MENTTDDTMPISQCQNQNSTPNRTTNSNTEESDKNNCNTNNVQSATQNQQHRSPFVCCICLEEGADIQDPVVALCGHFFCWRCIYRHLLRAPECPVCKAGCDREKLIPLYGAGVQPHEHAKNKPGLPFVEEQVPQRPAARPPPARPRPVMPQRRQAQHYNMFEHTGGVHIAVGGFGGVGVGPFAPFVGLTSVSSLFDPPAAAVPDPRETPGSVKFAQFLLIVGMFAVLIAAFY